MGDSPVELHSLWENEVLNHGSLWHPIFAHNPWTTNLYNYLGYGWETTGLCIPSEQWLVDGHMGARLITKLTPLWHGGVHPNRGTTILSKFLTGWWFQTFFIFHNIWNNPSHWLIFFKMVKTTNQLSSPNLPNQYVRRTEWPSWPQMFNVILSFLANSPRLSVLQISMFPFILLQSLVIAFAIHFCRLCLTVNSRLKLSFNRWSMLVTCHRQCYCESRFFSSLFCL